MSPGLPLPASLRRRAERFFGADLSTVRLHMDPTMPVAGLCRGEEIWLGRRAQGLDPIDQLTLIGHELTHVLQARAGRGDGGPQSEARLEAEADAIGLRFAYAPTSRAGLPGGRSQGRAPARAALKIGARPIHSETDISSELRMILNLIPGAPAWLMWAMQPAVRSFHFANEGDFVLGVQEGIHASRLVPLGSTGLLVGPTRLLDLEPEQLAALYERAMTPSPSAAQEAQFQQRVLQDAGLFTVAELGLGSQYLSSLGIADCPAVQVATLAEKIKLMQAARARQQNTPEAEAAAAKWAARHAGSLGELLDLMRAWAALPSTEGANAAPALREVAAEQAWNNLLPALVPGLTAVRVPGPLILADLTRALAVAIGGGAVVGFESPGAGLFQMLSFSRYQNQSGDEARALVAAYLQAAQDVLRKATGLHMTLGQDGLSAEYRLAGQTAQGDVLASVRLSAAGDITLAGLSVQTPNWQVTAGGPRAPR